MTLRRRLADLEAAHTERQRGKAESAAMAARASLTPEDLEARLKAAGIPTRAKVKEEEAALRAQLAAMTPEELAAEGRRASQETPPIWEALRRLLRQS